MSSVTEAVVVPLKLVACTATLPAAASVAVPEITAVFAFSARPAGKLPLVMAKVGAG